MACKVAENPPLKRLRADLGLAPICHSFRADCIHRLPQPEPKHNLGGPGAAIGYCQALFNRLGSHQANTIRISRLLKEVSAPWYNSHELYWGNRGDTPISDYVLEASEPLIGDGRVPILITALDAYEDRKEIGEILNSESLVVPGETILVRVLISNEQAQASAIRVMKMLLGNAEKSGVMPRWWPLLQGDLTPQEWAGFAEKAGALWKYSNIAMNPFMNSNCFDYLRDQITVAQVPVGLSEGVHSDGIIQMAEGQVRLTGAPEIGAQYNLFNYFERAKQLTYAPILLVLGPALPEWGDIVNQKRLEALVPVLETGCRNLWHGLSEDNYNMVWNFAA